jgi:hypothetical protein
LSPKLLVPVSVRSNGPVCEFQLYFFFYGEIGNTANMRCGRVGNTFVFRGSVVRVQLDASPSFRDSAFNRRPPLPHFSLVQMKCPHTDHEMRRPWDRSRSISLFVFLMPRPRVSPSVRTSAQTVEAVMLLRRVVSMSFGPPDQDRIMWRVYMFYC